MLRVMLLLFTLALLAAAGAALWAAQALTRPLPIDAPVIVEVAPGAALGQVAASLAARGILPTPELLTAWGRVTGKAAGLHVGEYRVEPGTDARGLLEQFVRGKVLRRSLTLLPGWRFGDVRRALEAAPRLAQTLGDADGAEIMARLGAPGVAPEGRFFPDTYDYVAGDTDLALLRRAHARMQAVLAEEWARRVPDLPLTSPDEALVLASLIEKETGVATDRARIAGVFTRRLELGMRLQTDPAVIYGLGDAFDGNLTRRDLRTPTPWNTYMNSGLPPTPIALPGRESIRAALAPAVDSALYFVARGDGSSEFSATLAE
ncbi:MAG TPA: endolytic transglycosylase MltG, partial [Pseudomonadales bacterium]|nr:endolytic transglycosylase MltG [Pseudomonadales bacterium]